MDQRILIRPVFARDMREGEGNVKGAVKKMVVKDYESLIEYIRTSEIECAYKLVILFAAIKMKGVKGEFNRDRLIDFFISFYRNRERRQLASEENCEPFEGLERDKIIQILNRKPISSLLKVEILKTFERFAPPVFKIVFDKEEDVLNAIRERIIQHFVTTLRDSRVIMEGILSDWEENINEIIKADALKAAAGDLEKIDLAFMLRYLYQSYSLSAFTKFLEQTQLQDESFNAFFTGDLESYADIFRKEVKAPVEVAAAAISETKPKISSSAKHMKDLTSLFLKIKAEEEEEAPEDKTAKKKKDKKKSKTQKKKK